MPTRTKRHRGPIILVLALSCSLAGFVAPWFEYSPPPVLGSLAGLPSAQSVSGARLPLFGLEFDGAWSLELMREFGQSGAAVEWLFAAWLSPVVAVATLVTCSRARRLRTAAFTVLHATVTGSMIFGLARFFEVQTPEGFHLLAKPALFLVILGHAVSTVVCLRNALRT